MQDGNSIQPKSEIGQEIGIPCNILEYIFKVRFKPTKLIEFIIVCIIISKRVKLKPQSESQNNSLSKMA